MSQLLYILPALACPIGMGLMMFFMAKGMRARDKQPAGAASLDDLRGEHARLGDEIERLEQDPRRAEPLAHR